MWQDGFHPIELSTNEMMDQKLAYLHNNSVVEEFVDVPEFWKRSSAGFYLCNEESELALQRIE